MGADSDSGIGEASDSGLAKSTGSRAGLAIRADFFQAPERFRPEIHRPPKTVPGGSGRHARTARKPFVTAFQGLRHRSAAVRIHGPAVSPATTPYVWHERTRVRPIAGGMHLVYLFEGDLRGKDR
ncbi:hypothetical protein Sm713_66720 [Streptomyces sp. TS71-3]|nr:hypothetical protein Sm713_66720 [Streptomyces sp. TS71-3]